MKYEEVYLKAYAPVTVAKVRLGTYLAFYNACRPHQSPEARRRIRSMPRRFAAGKDAAQ